MKTRHISMRVSQEKYDKILKESKKRKTNVTGLIESLIDGMLLSPTIEDIQKQGIEKVDQATAQFREIITEVIGGTYDILSQRFR